MTSRITHIAILLIALCFLGFASAADDPAGGKPLPATGVTAFSTEVGVVVSWSIDDAPYHWIAWLNKKDFEDAQAAGGDWRRLIHYAITDVQSPPTMYRIMNLPKGKDYWVTVGSANSRSLDNVAWAGGWSLVNR